MQTGITIKWRGQEHEVGLDNDGTFWVTAGEQTLRASSVTELRAQVEAMPRKKIAVPFTTTSRTGTVQRGIATGVHADGRKLLIRWGNGTARQVSFFELQPCMRELTAEEVGTLEDLHAERDRVNEEINSFTKAHALDLRAAIDAELAKP